MIELLSPAELPTTGMSVFGKGPRLATSNDLSGGLPREHLIAEMQISRSSTLHSLVSAQSDEVSPAAATRAFVTTGFLEPQLTILADKPHNSGARTSAAVMLLALGRAGEAIALLRQGDSSDYWISHHLTIALARNGQREEAKTIVGTLVESRPSDYRPLHVLGRLLIDEAAWASARDVLERATALDPKDCLVFNDLAVVHLEQREPNRALRALRRALDILPTCSLALNNLGVCYRMRSDELRARRYFLEAYRVDSRCVPAIHNLAECYIADKEYDSATAMLEDHLRLNPDDRHAKERLSWTFYCQKRLNDAIRVTRDLTDGGSPVYNNLALFYGAKNEWRTAIEMFERAITLDPSNTIARVNFAQLLSFLKKWRHVIAVLGDSPLQGNIPALRLLLGALVHAREFERAFDLLEQHLDSVEIDPNLAAGYGYLLTSYKDNIEGAIDVLRMASERHSQSPGVANNLGYALLKGERLIEARTVLSPWIDKDTVPIGDQGACLLASWGLLLIKEGKFDEGIQFYRSAKTRGSDELKERIRQKIMVEEGRHWLFLGKLDKGAGKLRESIRTGQDPEFREEARQLLLTGGRAN
jgi:Flp pilus assembly protein TadD